MPGFPVLHYPPVFSNSCPLSWWCHPANSSSVVPFSSCSQSFPAAGSFPMSQLLASGDQNIGASASVLPMNVQGWFSLNWLVISPCCQRDSQQSSPAPQFESVNSLSCSLLYGPALTSVVMYSCVLLEKPQFWLYGPLSVKWCLCFLICCLDLFPSKEQASFNFMAAVTIHNDFGAQKNKVCHCFHFLFLSSICHEVMGLDATILVFCILSLSQLFQSPLSPSSWGCLVPLCFLHKSGIIYIFAVIHISTGNLIPA